MATKPEDINPFAQFVETPKVEPTSDINPFAKFEPYSVGTGLADVSKMIGAGLIGPTAAAPQGIESAIRNIPRQVLEQQTIEVPEKIGPMTFAEELVKKGPAQLFTNVARSFVKDATGESFEKQQERQKDNEIALDQLISKAPRIPGTEGLAKWGKGKSEDLTKSVSEVGRARIADSQVEGNIVKAIQNRSVDELSFGKDPSVMGYALQGSQVLGSLVPVIATAVVTKGSPKAVGTLGFGMGAGEAVDNAQEHISKMNDVQLAEASPYFKQMIAKGVDPAEARKVVTDKAAEYAAQLQGSVSAFGDVITGKLMTGQFDKLLTGPIKSKLGRIALGTAAGSAEEGTQEFLEGIASDIGINKAVIKEIGEDSFANFILGAMGGAGPGAYRGAVAKRAEEPAAPPTVEPVTAIPAVPPTTPSLTPVKDEIQTTPTAPVAPAGALIEPEQVAAPEAVAPTGVPVAPVAPTAGLTPEMVKQVELLQKQYAELEKRNADPTNTPLEQEINNELQTEITQKIEQIVTAPTPEITPVEAPPVAEAPVVTPTEVAPIEALDPELKARAEMRINQLLEGVTDPSELNVRDINKLARELDLEPSKNPIETATEIVQKLRPESEPVSITPEPSVPAEEEVVTEPVEAPKQYNFGSGNIDTKVSQALPEDKYKEIYGTDGGILSFELEGPGVDSESGFKSVAGVTYEGKMTPERLEQMTAKVASMNSKPEEKAKPTKEQQAEINRQRQEEKKAIAAAQAKIKARESLTPEDIAFAGQVLLRGNGLEYNDEAKPTLKKLEEAGLIIQKKGKVFKSKEAEEAGIKHGDFFSPFTDSEDMRKVKEFLSPEKKVEAKEEVKAEKKEEISGVDQKFKIAQDISKYFLEGKSFDTILEARKFISGITGQKIESGTAEAKAADETVEVGVVLAAQEIAKQDKTPAEIYDDLVDLYNRQPNLAVRSSTSVQEQAYSTPAPLAYVASQLANITPETTVYEPTAGNGMLLIDANPKNVIANELNKDRFEMLKRVLPDAEVVNKNAIKFDPTLSDRVIANPPFGAIGEELLVSTFKTREIDHAIVYASLSRMPVNGKAVLIVGGVRADGEEARREGYRSKQKREFYSNLYRNYNVTDHFSVAGSMYKKQGAAYPVDVIVIDGKGQSERALPAADLPQIISSYEQLKEKLNEPSLVSRERDRTTRVDSGAVAEGERRPQEVGGRTVGQGVEPSTAGREPTGVSEPSVSEAGAAERGRAEPTRAEPSEGQPEPANVPKRGDESGQPVPSGTEAVEPVSGTGTKGNIPSELGGPSVVSGKRVESGLKERRGLETETEGQASYDPHSQATSVGTLVPRAMKDAIDASLNKIEDQVGNLDEFVADALGMDPETLRSDFSAEQIDALALAIQNAEAGKGFIIGDQTGIGKGRVVAAMIKFALKNGKIPIFVTEKPNLYSDMIRDLDDIGMTKELALDTKQPKIFITNGGESIPYQLIRTGKDGEITETNLVLKAPKSGKALDDMMKDMRAKESLGDYKVIFTTYSQMQTVKNKPTERQGFIKDFGLNNYMIFDESHNAGGGGETQARSKEQKASQEEGKGLSTGRAAFVRQLVNDAYGTFFSSATYAKRPDVMDLYSSTDMKLAVDKISDLSDAIKHGGVPMQQVVANMLTKAGQYIRRERTFAGVSYDTTETKVDKKTAENMASAMRSILGFSRAKDVAIKQIQKEMDKEGKVASGVGAEGMQIQGANFGSVMHNLIDQMLLSLKAQSSIDHAIQRLKAGEKVVMTVSNTMGSFLQSYAEDMGINTGDPVNLSFSDLYQRYLEKQRMVTIKGPEGKVQRMLTDAELGPTLVERYKQIQKQIADSGFGSAPISPIDYMHNELRKAGYKTDEITGRTNTLDYSTGTPLLATRSANIKQRVGAVRGFNNGDTDVIILNQAGSTGLSLHASDKFKDQRKRHMIIVQPEKNIDTHMQMLGRVHRTGQIIAPAYSQMMADIPAEMRPAAVLLKKMASLNANTTASRKSSVTAEGVVDFMNEYGGQVVQEYLRDNPDVMDAIGGDKIIKLSDDPSEATEGDIRKFTGYVPILPIKEQEEIYKDIIERYNELLERENSMGTNKLEAKAVDLDAETISKTTITEDKGEDSEFARPAVMEQVDVKRTVKPYSSQEVKDMLKENLDGKTVGEVAEAQQIDLRDRARPYATERIEKIKQDGGDEVKVNAVKGLLDMQYTHVRTILQNYEIGTPVSVTDTNGVYVYGIITDVTNAKRTVNPAAGSDWKMQIALANGDARSITLSFSQIGSVYKLEPQGYDVNWFNPETQQAEYVKVIDIFDKGATVRREKRWMVTGNILAGFAQYPGQIMTYTKKDGTVGQGVLMSRQFDFEKVQKEAPVKLKSADDVMKFFTEVGGQAGTSDNIMRISMRGGNFTFMVPASKRTGGTYFLDRDLINTLGTDFYKRGSDMLASTWQDDKAKAAINYLLKNRGETLVTLTGTDKARELFQPPKVLKNINITPQQAETQRQEIRQDQIKRQAELSRGITKMTKEIVKGNIGLNVQRQLTQLTQEKEAIKSEIARTKEAKVSAEWFRTRASAENAAGNMTDATYAVVDALAKRFPKMLDGLRLSVRSTKGLASGNFNPLERLVTVYNSGSDSQDRTMRHEIAHSLEQMMTPEAQIAVVESWGENLQKAIEKYTDLPHQEYFQAVLDFIEKPTETNFNKATNKIPEYEMYQYINPSEYWAVNAEKLLKSSLGSPWARFVKGVQKIWEAMKSVLGMNNRYAVHKEFNRIMSGEQDRITHKMLVQYVTDNANALRFLNNVEDFDKQFEADGFANTPVKVSRHLKDRLLGGYAEAKHIYDRMKTNPLMTSQAMGGKLVRAITYVRNKNVYFAAGLERADLISQKNAGLDGMLRDSEGKAVASIAVTNALHAGHIGSEVILRGSLGYNQQTQMFQAVRRDFSMANVLMYKHDLIERVGLQRATNMINKFFEAKRSKSILDDYNKREKELLSLENEYANPKTSDTRMGQLVDDILDAKKALKSIGIAKKKVNMTKEQIKFYGDLEKENPELRQMLNEWTKVNDNMIDMMLFSRIISKQRAEQLKGIKDYVPWYRIQEDMQDVHEPSQMGGVRGLSNVGKLKLFKDTETDLDIDDIVDNMLHNVMMITRNSMRNYAANRVAQEYATRNAKGQIAVFPKEGPDPATGAVRTNILVNGRRIIIEIKDPLIAEAVIGMENIDMPAVKVLSSIANGLRRGITLWPEFQLKQLFMDAPTAALVSGVKNPNQLWAGTFRGFIKALKSDDPVVDMLKSYGIGGYQSYTRTPEKEYKQKIGLLEKNKFDMLMQKLDQIGDASDYAQRIAIYNRVKAETGDEMLALMQANNVIDFLKRGSGRTAQFLTKTVSFMNAYAQQIDVLAMTLVGGKLTGKSRAAALAQLAKTGAMFGMYAMLYSWAVGGHDDYEELDDQTKLRNIYIPKDLTKEIGMSNGLLIPMHTSASFFFKSIPELTYNAVTKEGTANEMDATRLRKALATAAVDSLLGPNPVPTAIKPLAEITLNKNFFTGSTLVPRGLEGLDAASQYTANTSELGKVISALTGNPFNEKRVLNPVEADHLVRSLFGTTGAAVQWGSNLFSGERPTPRARDNPLFGSFIAADVGRAPEDLFYGLKQEVDGKYKTYMDFMNNGDFEKADKYFDKYEKEIVAHDYISSMDNALREINSMIRNIGKAKNDMTPDQRREEITYLQKQKSEILDGIIEMRKEAGL